jgi:hypothetical protein
MTNKGRRPLVMWGLAALAVLAIGCASEPTASDDGGTSQTSGPATKSANTDHPPQADVTLGTCAVDDAGFITAKGLITNHSSKASDYFVHVEFVAGGTRYAEGIAAASGVAPSQQAEWEASGLTDARSGTECKITDVERTAS